MSHSKPCSEQTKAKLREINSRPEEREKRRQLALAQWANGFQGSRGRKHSDEEKAKAVKTRRARGSYVFSTEVRDHLARLNRSPERRELSRLVAKEHLAPISRSEAGRERARRAALALITRPERRSGLEQRFQAWLERKGVQFVVQFELPGAPGYLFDFAVAESRTLIEVDGCYWHGCKRCGYEGVKKTRVLDKRKTEAARKLGWKIWRIRECSLNKKM